MINPFEKKRFNSFTYLNITQFLGALNDQIFKFLIAYFLIENQGVENSPKILATAGAVFVIPFLLISASAGKLADRYSKRNIIVLCKFMEAIIMALGIISFIIKSEWGSYCILFLMATQSAIFSPSKYGIVPELVSNEKISRANGLLTTLTFLAIIIGTFLASFLTDISERNFVFSSAICTLISIIGLYTSFYIEQTPSAGSKKSFNTFFLNDVYKTILRARQKNRLFCAILSSAYFLFLSSFVQLNMVPFAIQSLGLTDTQGGYLFLMTALGIGMGSLIAGKLSGKHVELGFIPFAGFGMGILTLFLYLFSDNLMIVAPTITALGIFGGLWIVPMDSFIQVASPKNYRGQMVATTNFLSFSGVLFSAGALYLFSEILCFSAATGFVIIGLLTMVVSVIITIAILDYFLRFVSFSFSRLFFSLSVSGYDKVPKATPALMLCNRSTSFIDTLLLTAIQRPPLRFLVETSRCQNKWLRLFFSWMHVIFIPEYTEEDSEFIYNEAKKGMDKGYTVCIFAKTAKDNDEAMEKYFDDFQSRIIKTPYAIIPVKIDEKPLHPPSGRLWDLIKVFPWRVTIAFGSSGSTRKF